MVVLSNGSDAFRMDELELHADEVCQTYERLLHYCNFETLKCIFKNRTLRCSSLDYANLNDLYEKQRIGIEEYTCNVFISCFCHRQTEKVPFWYDYGGKDYKHKVLIRFPNFTKNINDYINTDYALTVEGKKVFFYCPEYGATINSNSPYFRSPDSLPIKTDYDLRNCIKSLRIKDVDYRPKDDETFTANYSGEADVSFGKDMPSIETTTYDITSLGLYKTEPWDYEEETRIILSLEIWGSILWNQIDLRLKDLIFKDMIIALNPWADDTFSAEINSMIDECDLSDEIKHSIHIIRSDLDGKLKEPT